MRKANVMRGLRPKERRALYNKVKTIDTKCKCCGISLDSRCVYYTPVKAKILKTCIVCHRIKKGNENAYIQYEMLPESIEPIKGE